MAMENSSFTIPVENRYFEDYIAGAVHLFGATAVTEDDIISFATQFDPQIFHLDPEAAKSTVYEGLIASGWHTAAMTMRLLVDHFISRAASLGSPGVDELRWIKPVRPGDELSIRVTILEANRSRSKPDRGIVISLVETLNQGDEVVMSMKGVNILLCREVP